MYSCLLYLSASLRKGKGVQQCDHSWWDGLSIKSLYPILISFNNRENRKFTLPDLLFFFTGNILTPVLIPHPWGHQIEFFFLHPKEDCLPFYRGKMSDFAVLMFFLVRVRNADSQDLKHKGHFEIRCSLLYVNKNSYLKGELRGSFDLRYLTP